MCFWCNVCFLCVHVWSFYIVVHPVCCCYALWKVTSLSLLLTQLSKVLRKWPCLCALQQWYCLWSTFLLTGITHQLSLLQGKSVALISPVIRPVTEKVELDKCLPVASKHLFIEIFGSESEWSLNFGVFLSKTNLRHQKWRKNTQWGLAYWLYFSRTSLYWFKSWE